MSCIEPFVVCGQSRTNVVWLLLVQRADRIRKKKLNLKHDGGPYDLNTLLVSCKISYITLDRKIIVVEFSSNDVQTAIEKVTMRIINAQGNVTENQANLSKMLSDSVFPI